MDFDVRGADDFLKLSKALKAAGEDKLRKELNKGIREGVKPVSVKAEKRLRESLPYAPRGGGKAVSQTVQPRTGRDPGVRVVVRYGSKRASNAQSANSKGVIRHPVFADFDLNSGAVGRKGWRWVNQSVPSAKGWFDDTYRDAGPEVRRSIELAMQAVADEVVRKAK